MTSLAQLGLSLGCADAPDAEVGLRQAWPRSNHAPSDDRRNAAIHVPSCIPHRGRRTAARSIHLVGAAGSGMSALADLLRGAGHIVTGSDCLAEAQPGINGRGEIDATPAAWIRAGHAEAHLPPDCELVVHSPAVHENNVELVAARRLGVPTIGYPQMLGQLMSQRRGLAVAGTHGKSTTTAMTAAVLAAAGLDATVVVGATPLGSTSGGRFGAGPLLLAEACEYRSHFHYLQPDLAVLLGIEWDHVDCFPSLASVEAAFDGFVSRTARDGLVIASAACPATRRVASRTDRRCELFGVEEAADWRTEISRPVAWRAVDLNERQGRYSFSIQYRERSVCAVALQTPGRHNVHNALAAAALAWHAGADGRAIQAGLNGFRGMKRRLEFLGEFNGVSVVDDYAHHPTEVAASLAALRAWFGKRRIWCVFQPHQAARTLALLDEFARSMHNADRVIVADVFLAREPAEAAERVSAADLAERVAALGGRVAPVHALDDLINWLRAALRPGDVLVTMGAGDIGKVAHDFVQRV